jgi:hypothetical protein
MLSRQPVGRRGRDAQPLAFAPLGGHAQAFLAPQPLDGLAVDRPPLLAELGVRPAIIPPGMRPAELAQLVTEGSVPVRFHGLVALGGAVLPDQLARPPLGDPEYPLKVLDGAAPAGRAHQFPRPSSFKASIWSSLSATIRFSRAFSLSAPSGA